MEMGTELPPVAKTVRNIIVCYLQEPACASRVEEVEKYHNEQELQRAQMQKHGSMPLFHHDNMYVGNVTVGTPGQTVFLMMDTGSSNVWMIDARCHSLGCNGVYGFGRRKFDSTKSVVVLK
ncbi:Inositol hexakisphosphate and diphosphoinositol-pentakisphosphate kinase [Parelaphostrongylus tenuis]|uniref:Inositol hexakisphosphate and diphosphoinositol-pentakisphosphate kinase n=1 Tax=Parelaphostrongylus tenuis TaxID=148309 RepID=A0AAD5R6C0_PARTN|nr:Inositol hexakisphosphate and diphosphoinositol-pentakisphosphate kinase [Parelaphostrongylus tenuis]